jgi:hypothetical protein
MNNLQFALYAIIVVCIGVLFGLWQESPIAGAWMLLTMFFIFLICDIFIWKMK